ncbi:MAG: DUF4070 domain-containing protein [Myxococcota bacterium]
MFEATPGGRKLSQIGQFPPAPAPCLRPKGASVRRRGAGRAAGLRDLPNLWQSVLRQGLPGIYRSGYWSFLAWVIRHCPEKLALAIAQACAGHHFITYTRNTVVPSLQASLGETCDKGHDPLPRELPARMGPGAEFESA